MMVSLTKVKEQLDKLRGGTERHLQVEGGRAPQDDAVLSSKECKSLVVYLMLS